MIEAKKLFLEPLDFESPDADDFFRKLLSGSTSKSLSDAEKIYLEGHVLSVGTSQSSDSSLVEKASEEPSDGGLQGWVQCVCSFLLFFNSWGLINSFGVFQEYYQTTYLPNTSPSAIAWIGSLQGALMMAANPITGPLFDRGYAKSLVATGTLIGPLGMMMASLSTEYWQLMLSQGVMVGLGQACLFVPALAVLPAYFTKHRMAAVGISNSGSSIGAIAYTVIFRQLSQALGFGWAVRCMGFIMLACQIFALIFLKQRRPITASGAPQPKPRKMWDSTAFKEPSFITYAFCLLTGNMGIFVPFFFAQAYAQAFNIAQGGINFYLVAIINAGSFCGRVLPMVIGDITGPINAALPVALMVVIIGACWVAVKSTAGIIVFCSAYGFVSGAYISLALGIVTTLSPNLAIMGTRMGMMSLPMAIGLMIGTPVAGALGDKGWIWLQVFCPACLAVAMTLMFATRTFKVGWQLRRKV